MSVCEHDPDCPGYGWEHEANLTPEARRELGLPDGPISMKKARRKMRSHRRDVSEGSLYSEIGALRSEIRSLKVLNRELRKQVTLLEAVVESEEMHAKELVDDAEQ